ETDDLHLTAGRIFTQREADLHSNVVVLGHDTAAQLFEGQSPLGKEVEIEGQIFTVIGVFDKVKSIFGGNGSNPEDNRAVFPLGTFRKLHPEEDKYWLSAKYDDAKNKNLVEDELREVLRRQRKLRADQPDN